MVTLDDMQVLQTNLTKPTKHFFGGKTKRQYSPRRNRTKHLYDANANITSIDDGVNVASYDRTMGYDDLDRLTSASGFWGVGSYSFDALGNILSKAEDGATMTYNYNTSLNRLTGITGANAMSFSYDERGNVTDNGNNGFVYNLAGNMTSSTSPAILYEYDGHKRRVKKTEGGQTVYSVYSSAGTLMHKKVGGVSTDYIYAGSLLVAEKTGSTVDYMYTDLLGSPIAGNNGSSYKEHYRPWGEKKDHPIQLADDVGYTGHQDDVATGLTYMQARYYDSVVGRFMAADPIGFTASNPMSFGQYVYANNNPYRYLDPDGANAVTFVGGLITESFNFVTGNGFDSSFLGGALIDGYDGEGQGFGSALFDDVTTFVPLGIIAGAGIKGLRLLKAGKVANGRQVLSKLKVDPKTVLSGGRGGRNVKSLVGPPNAAVRGGGQRAFVTNDKGQVILDITKTRVKPVSPGQGFGPKRAPTQQELDILQKVLGDGS